MAKMADREELAEELLDGVLERELASRVTSLHNKTPTCQALSERQRDAR